MKHCNAKAKNLAPPPDDHARCGWFDAVGVRHAVRMNGMTGIALIKLDVLTGFKKIPICTAYRYDGQTLITEFPAS